MTQRDRVYRAICESRRGMTDREIQLMLGMDGSTERPRRLELVERGLVRQDGTRQGENGRYSAVWRAV